MLKGTRHLNRHGGSLAVYLPPDLVRTWGLKEGGHVTVAYDSSKLVITPPEGPEEPAQRQRR